MKRRRFLTLFSSELVVRPLAADAQPPYRVRRAGMLIKYAESDADTQAHLAAFR